MKASNVDNKLQKTDISNSDIVNLCESDELKLNKKRKKKAHVKWHDYLKSVLFLVGLMIVIGVCDFAFAKEGYVHDILQVLHQGYEVDADGTVSTDTSSDSGYDTIILGASHGRSAIDPDKIDFVLGTNTLNVCIPGETVKDSYYLLLEAARTNNIENLILDVDYQYYLGSQDEGYFEEAFIYNQLPWTSYVKWKYILDNMNNLDFRNAISKRDVYRHSASDIKANIVQKFSEDYLKANIYKLDVEDCGGPYEGKGFFYRLQTDNFYNGFLDDDVFAYDTEVADVSREYFEKIKKFCDENGINLICVTSPITPSSYNTLHIVEVHKTMSDFFNSYGVTYIDYNMTSQDVLSRSDSDFVDAEGHMCGVLAERYSALLAQNLSELKDKDISQILDEVYGGTD